MNSKILYITSFDHNLYKKSGCLLIKSFIDNMDSNKLLICYEGNNYLSYLKNNNNLIFYNLNNDKYLNTWLENNKDIIPIEYGGLHSGNYKDHLQKKIIEFNYLKQKIIKKEKKYMDNLLKKQPYFLYKSSLFFRKIASLNYAINNYSDNYDYFIWIDSDVIIKKKICNTFIQNIFKNKYVFYLLGQFRYDKFFRAIESCFIGFKKSIGFNILKDIINFYKLGEFRNLFRWDDGFVFGHFLTNNLNSIDLCDNNSNENLKINSEVIIFSPFKNYLVHNKGIHNKNIYPKNIEIENNILKDRVIKKIYFVGVGEKGKNNSYYLRGKQIVKFLKKKFNLNIISCFTYLDKDYKKISNSIIFIIKKIELNKKNSILEEYNIVKILKNNNNILIHDLIDLDYNIIFEKRKFYDIYITCNYFYKKLLDEKLKDKIIYYIPHHLDFRLNNLKCNLLQEIKLVYFGGINYKNEKNCYFIENLINDFNLEYIKWNSNNNFIDYIEKLHKFNVHVDIRNEKDMNYKIKPGTKTVVAAAFNSIVVTTKHPGAYELLGPNYPYYCDCNYESVKETINLVYKTFNKKEWNDAISILKKAKDYLNINNIIHNYYNLILKLS